MGARLLEHAASSPLLLVLARRTDTQLTASLALEQHDVRSILLRGLTRAQVATLVAATLGHAVPPAVADAVATRTAGNPFFVEQISLALAGTSADALPSTPDALPLPLTVEAAVQSRLDALPPTEKDLCRRAAVFGRAFSVDELAALDVPAPERGLAALRSREILAAQGVGRAAFKSSLVADVAYRMLGDDLRLELHARAGRFLARFAGGAAHDAEDVAGHFSRANLREDASRWYARAALDALTRGDAVTVLRTSEASLSLGPPPELHTELLLARIEALRFRGDVSEQTTAIDAALPLARNAAERARVLSERAVTCARAGRHDEALIAAERAVEEARIPPIVPEALFFALGRLVLVLLPRRELVRAKACLAETASLDVGARPALHAKLLEWKAQLASAIGELGTRRDAFRDALATYEALLDDRRAAGAEANLADVLNRVGAYRDAEAALVRAIARCVRFSHRWMEGYARANLAYSLMFQERHAEALQQLAQAERLTRSLKDPRLEVAVAAYRSRAERALGDLHAATTSATIACTKARALGQATLLAEALTCLAEVALSRGELTEAQAASREAYEICRRLGGIEEGEAEVYLTRAAVLEASSAREEAATVRQEGRARVLAMADEIADVALRAKFLQDVAAHRALVSDDSAARRA